MSELLKTKEYEDYVGSADGWVTYQLAQAMHDELLARIAEMEAELATVNSLLDMKREREQHWSDEAWRYKDMNEQLRAERKAT